MFVDYVQTYHYHVFFWSQILLFKTEIDWYMYIFKFHFLQKQKIKQITQVTDTIINITEVYSIDIVET